MAHTYVHSDWISLGRSYVNVKFQTVGFVMLRPSFVVVSNRHGCERTKIAFGKRFRWIHSDKIMDPGEPNLLCFFVSNVEKQRGTKIHSESRTLNHLLMLEKMEKR